MEYNNKNEHQEFYDKYLFNQRKIKYISVHPNKEKENMLDSFKSNNNALNIPLIKKNEKTHMSYNKNNIKGLHIPEYELINLKREEAPRLFSKNYMNENKRRLINRNYNFEESNISSKFKNSFFSNFPHKNINLDNYYLKLEYNNNYYLTVPNEIDNNNSNVNKKNIINNSTKKTGINTESSVFKKKNNKENKIILPLNLEYKGKNYGLNDYNGNFMEKYEYYLLNLNKNKSQKNKNIQKENNSKNIKNYFNTYSNFPMNNNELQKIEPYKYKQYNINIEKKNNINYRSLTDRGGTLQNCKYLTKYLDDSYTKKILNKNSNSNSNSKKKNENKKINIHINNNFKDILNNLQRKVLCINEKNEDIGKRNAISLLGQENENLNNKLDNYMNSICRIKNFSIKEDSNELIPFINTIILNKKDRNSKGIQKFDNMNDLNNGNNNKFDILNKDLKVFDLEKNYKYGYNEEEEERKYGGMFYSLIKQRNARKNRFFLIRNKIRYNSHLNLRTKLCLKKAQKLKRFKSCDNKNNNVEDNDSFYIPSLYHNKKKKSKKNLFNFGKKSNYTRPKITDNRFYFTDNLPKFGDNIINKSSKMKKINFPINNIKIKPNNKTSRKNLIIEDEGAELKNFIKSYKSKKNIKSENKKNKNEIKKKHVNNSNEEIKNSVDDKNNKEQNKNKTINKNIKKILFKEGSKVLKNYKINIKKNKSIYKINNNEDYNIKIKKSNLNSNNTNNFETKTNYNKPSIIKKNDINKKHNNKKGNFSNKDKIKKLERRKTIQISFKYKRMNSRIVKYKSKHSKKWVNNTDNKKDNIQYNTNNDNKNNYIKLLNMLKAEDNKYKLYEKEKEISKTPQRNKRNSIQYKNNSKIKKYSNFLSQKSLKSLKKENYEENNEILNNKSDNKESKFKKKKSNLSKFKNIINKMRDMPIEDYMNYIEKFYGYIDRNENNFYYIDEQSRINNFLESMRKNIEKFKGRQNILQINCQPIDYIETVGNGLGNNISYTKNNSSSDSESSKNDLNNENNSD